MNKDILHDLLQRSVYFAISNYEIGYWATTTTTVSPISTRYFTVVTGDVAGGATLTLDTAEFFDDAGNTPAGLPALNPETLPLNYL